MPNEKLVKWIRYQLSKGYSLDKLRQTLLSGGWKERDIEEAARIIQSERERNKNSILNITKNKNFKIILIILISIIVVLGIFLFLVLNKGVLNSKAENILKNNKSTNVEDCGASFNCLALAAQNCTPSKITVTAKTTVLGVTKSVTAYYEIEGANNSKCTFYTEIKKANITFPAGTSQSTISEQQSAYQSMEGESGTCLFNNLDLVAMLSRWSHGEFSSHDFNIAQCQGSYFNKTS